MYCMQQESHHPSRSQLEEELETRIVGKLIEFMDALGGTHFGYVDSVSVWPDPKNSAELEVTVQLNGHRYKMSHGFFTHHLKVLSR